MSLVALALIVASAFVSWFEWSVRNWPETRVSTTTIWGPPNFVPGSPQYGSVQVPNKDEQVVDLSVLVYLSVLLLGLASLLPVPFWTLSEHWGRRAAAWCVAIGGLSVYVSIAVAVGVVEFMVGKTMRHWAVQSTWIVTFEIQRLVVVGPLLLFAGAVTGIMGGVAAFHSHHAQVSVAAQSPTPRQEADKVTS